MTSSLTSNMSSSQTMILPYTNTESWLIHWRLLRPLLQSLQLCPSLFSCLPSLPTHLYSGKHYIQLQSLTPVSCLSARLVCILAIPAYRLSTTCGLSTLSFLSVYMSVSAIIHIHFLSIPQCLLSLQLTCPLRSFNATSVSDAPSLPPLVKPLQHGDWRPHRVQ